MNSITLVKNLLDEENGAELTKYLPMVWNKVWSDRGELNYANLRLFKTVDKIKRISDLGVDFRKKLVLDIGCGDGTSLMYLRRYFDIQGVGVDISETVVKKLQEGIKDDNLAFHVGDHRDLTTIPSNHFDVVLSFGVIEHFNEFSLALAEARRALKPGGYLVLIQPHLLSFGVIQELFLRFRGRWKFGKQKDFSCFHYCALLKQVGLKNIVTSTAIPYPDMGITRFFDLIVKVCIPFWGHYLYLIAKK